MPKAAAKLIVDFIEEIPDSKLSGLPSKSGTIYDDTNFRLDMQGVGVSVESNRAVQRANVTAVDNPEE